MLLSVLQSKRAVHVNIKIMRAFENAGPLVRKGRKESPAVSRGLRNYPIWANLTIHP